MTPTKKSQSSTQLPIIIITVSALMACFSLYMIVSTLITGAQEQSAFDELTTKEAAIYDTSYDAKFGDNLLVLSTRAYHADNGCFVVVAKQIQ